MAKLYVPTIMRKNVDGKSSVDVSGATISDALAALVARYPDVGPQLLSEKGEILRHVNVFVNGDDIRGLEGGSTGLSDRDEIHVIPAMAGG
ncbi:ubiquitin-like small modifier protein 1 [Spirillospora sp. NPDC047279]|uniref:ubiquitin-like small modifier protein 1 n=1 Tax=Spirillospora sp. NPDC047279 TaxID=3155478 RepID=UPI0033C6666A